MSTTLDRLTASLTAFGTFEDMLNTDPAYRPSIYPRDARHVALADAYDAAMVARGDARRAFRGTPAPLLERLRTWLYTQPEVDSAEISERSLVAIVGQQDLVVDLYDTDTPAPGRRPLRRPRTVRA